MHVNYVMIRCFTFDMWFAVHQFFRELGPHHNITEGFYGEFGESFGQCMSSSLDNLQYSVVFMCKMSVDH